MMLQVKFWWPSKSLVRLQIKLRQPLRGLHAKLVLNLEICHWHFQRERNITTNPYPQLKLEPQGEFEEERVYQENSYWVRIRIHKCFYFLGLFFVGLQMFIFLFIVDTYFFSGAELYQTVLDISYTKDPIFWLLTPFWYISYIIIWFRTYLGKIKYYINHYFYVKKLFFSRSW